MYICDAFAYATTQLEKGLFIFFFKNQELKLCVCLPQLCFPLFLYFLLVQKLNYFFKEPPHLILSKNWPKSESPWTEIALSFVYDS